MERFRDQQQFPGGFVYIVTKGDITAVIHTLDCILLLASPNLLSKLGRIVFGISLQHRLQNNALRPIGNVFFDRDHSDTVFLQNVLIVSAIVAVTGKNGPVSNKYDIKEPFGTICNHSLKVRTIRSSGR